MAVERIKEFWPDWIVEDELSKGSYGTVYKARREYLGTVVYSAIKIIRIPADDSEVRTLQSEGMTIDDTKKYFEAIVKDFSNEIKLMDSLKSANNIVGVQDFKVVEKEENLGWDIYIRMELLETFENIMKSRRLSEDEVVKLGIDLCSALEACVKYNIIHRDIKPANIFVSPFGDYKIGDFGVARELEKSVVGMSKKGTYSYMAPEVMSGENYDHRVDIYSLGIVMYTLLNNNHMPFLDPNVSQFSYDDKKQAIDRRMSGEVLPPPIGASQELSKIILIACAFDREQRFESPTLFKNALKNYINKRSFDDTKEEEKDKKREFEDTVKIRPPKNIATEEKSQSSKTKKSTLSLTIVIITVLIIGCMITVFLFPKITELIEAGDGDAIGGVSSSVNWSYKDGTLTISGTGSMNDYNYDSSVVPWSDYADKIETVIVKEGVTHIGNSAFEKLFELREVSLPKGLESIGEGAFYKCEKLKSIDIPDSVTSIGGWTFSWCSSLSAVEMSKNLEILGDCAFQGCVELENIFLSDIVYRIGDSVFKECSADLCIVCPDGSYAEGYAKDNDINVKND